MSGDVGAVPTRMVMRESVMAFLLVNEVRHRLVEWVYGVPREDSNRMTLVAMGSMADGVQAGARLLAAGAVPSAAGVLIGAAAVKEAANGIAGEWSRTTPAFGALIAFALLSKSTGPALRDTVHGVRRTGHAVEAGARRFLAVLGGE